MKENITRLSYKETLDMVNRTYADSPGSIKKMYQIDRLSLLDVAYFETTGERPSLEVFDGLVDKASLITNQAMEAVEVGINSIDEKLRLIGSRLTGDDQKNKFFKIWKALESAREKSMASRVGYLKRIGVIKQEMISERGKINFDQSDDVRLLDVEGYQYNRRTIKRWKKAKMASEPALVIAEPVVEPIQRTNVLPDGYRYSDEIETDPPVQNQKWLRTIKRYIRDDIRYPISDAGEAIGRWFRGEDQYGIKLPSLWQRMKDNFLETRDVIFGRMMAKRAENKRYAQMDKERRDGLQSTPTVVDGDKLNPNPALSLDRARVI